MGLGGGGGNDTSILIFCTVDYLLNRTCLVSPALSPTDPELDNLINSAPVLLRSGALSYQEGGRQINNSLGEEPLRVPCRSLPLLAESSLNIVDKVEQKYNLPIR